MIKTILQKENCDRKTHLTIRIKMFEADVFRQIMEFVHTGKVELQPRTIVGESFTHMIVKIKGLYI